MESDAWVCLTCGWVGGFKIVGAHKDGVNLLQCTRCGRKVREDGVCVLEGEMERRTEDKGSGRCGKVGDE